MEVLNVNSNCPNCGAPIEIDQNAQAFICKYCSSIVAVVSREPNQIEAEKTNMPILRKIEPELRYQANHQVSASNAQGGHIWITKDEVVFKPHVFNWGPLDKRYIRIQDVVGYKKGAFTHMSIFTKSGYEMDIVVWKKDEIINEIEKRRVNYFQSQGLPVPQLLYNDGVKLHGAASPVAGGAIPAEKMSTNSGCLGVVAAFVISASALLYSIMC